MQSVDSSIISQQSNSAVSRLGSKNSLERKNSLEHKNRIDQIDLVGAAQISCFHCLEPMPKYGNLVAKLDGRLEPMCCIGCKAAAEFICQRGLMRFYQHRERLDRRDFFAEVANDFAETDTLIDANAVIDSSSQWQFLDSSATALAYIDKRPDDSRVLTLLVEGLYCSSCTWLIERALCDISNSLEFQADVDARRVRISVRDPSFKLSSVVDTIAKLGYQPTVCKVGDSSVAQRLAKQQRNDAIKRIVVAGFGMMQVMTYATAAYFGGSLESGGMDPQLERFFLLVSMLVATVVVFYAGKPFFDNALSDLANRHLGMDIPVSLAISGAYFPSVYIVLSHTNAHVYFDSAVMFVFFLSVGRYIEMRARHKLSGSGFDVQALLPQEIEVQRAQQQQMLSILIKPAEVIVGDQLQLRAHSIAPFDAKITGGLGQFDESLLSGEALAVNKSAGDLVLAGSRLLSGIVMLESTGSWSDSSIAKVQQSIQSAERSNQQEQARTQLISRYFILAVLLLTVVVASAWLLISPDRVFEVCLAMLIASCPCAFALAAPVGRSAAINSLRRKGVLLTSNAALDSLLKVSRFCFDKTGTLTRGRPSIFNLNAIGNLSEDRCLKIVACIEKGSNHVLSSAFNDIYTDICATNFNEEVGQGITAIIDGDRYRVGKRSWVLSYLPDNGQGIEMMTTSSRSEILLADANMVLAIIQLQDEIRPSAGVFLSTLRAHKPSHSEPTVTITVLSGDNSLSVKALCDELAIVDFKAGMLPTDKLKQIREYQSRGELVAMLGDGINDAPVLAAADVSIAMASGSELALNNADVVLLNGNLENLGSLIVTAKKAATITKQNLVWALIYNAIALPLAASGLLTPWLAALGMSLSSVIVVLNALRIRNTRLTSSLT
jgi:Cu2+-exporting ATPase